MELQLQSRPEHRTGLSDCCGKFCGDSLLGTPRSPGDPASILVGSALSDGSLDPASQAANPHPVTWPPRTGRWGPHIPKGDTGKVHSVSLKHTAGTRRLAQPLVRAEGVSSRGRCMGAPCWWPPFQAPHSRVGLDRGRALSFLYISVKRRSEQLIQVP